MLKRGGKKGYERTEQQIKAVRRFDRWQRKRYGICWKQGRSDERIYPDHGSILRET